MYLIEKESELTKDYLSKLLSEFQTKELPELNRLGKYYKGKQKILQKQPTDEGKPCNRIVNNFCYNITQNFLGYLTGKAIKYKNDEYEDVLNILSYNDVEQEDNEYLRQALIYGRAFEINYIDEDGQQRFKTLDSRQCVPIYNNNLNNELLYVVRFYREDLLDKQNENYIVEVYGPQVIRTYRSTPGFSSFQLIDEVPHFFGQCPVTVFSLNEDEESIYSQVISLQDGYNELLSGEIDDWDAFCDAYMVFKGVIADEEDLLAMKRNRVLMIDNDASAEYLTKDNSNTKVEEMLKNFERQIYKISNSPDFSDEKFFAQSGIALRYKLVGFENTASSIEKQMRKALQRRIENICAILYLTNNVASWRDVEIIFTRNLPDSVTPSTPQEIAMYKGLVSDKTLLSLLPFVNDPEEELKNLQEQKLNNIDLYSFGDKHEHESLEG